MPTVFISHTTTDYRDVLLAKALANGLQERGIDVWLAPEVVPGGKDFQEEIRHAIETACTDFLVILSDASIASEWVKIEVELARMRHARDSNFRVFPLPVSKKAEDAFPDFLGKLQRINFYPDHTEQLFAVFNALRLSPPRLPNSARTRIENFVVECAGPSNNPRPFGGRTGLLIELNRWIRDGAAPPYRLVTAPGGGGKSTLLVRWWQQLPVDWPCVFVPVSASCGTADSDEFLQVLAASLSSVLGIPEGGFGRTAAEAMQRIQNCLNKAGAAGKPLILIIDALDELEMGKWNLWRQIFPLDDPDSIKRSCGFSFPRDRLLETKARQIGTPGWDGEG
jgi:hypothetical protein